MQPPDDLVTLTEAAARIGVHKSTLSRQVAKGQIRSHDGRVRIAEVLADRSANVDLSNPGRGRRVARPDATQRSVSVGRPEGGAGEVRPFAAAQARKEDSLAKLRELEFAQKSGKLVDASRAEAAVFERARIERDAWTNWPSRVAPLIAAALEVDAVALAVQMERHVREHLAERANLGLRSSG